jgi:hypothetical protein
VVLEHSKHIILHLYQKPQRKKTQLSCSGLELYNFESIQTTHNPPWWLPW